MLKRTMALILVSTSAWAEPTPSVRWFMNTPASMFDVGMLRLRDNNRERWIPDLEKRLAGGTSSGAPPSLQQGSVVYNFDENRISISVVFNANPDEAFCARILKEYKDVISPLRTSSPEFAAASLAGVFDHVNYSAGLAPRGWQQELTNIIKITVGLELVSTPPPSGAPGATRRPSGGLSTTKSLFCSGPITSDEVSYQKFGM